MVVGLKSVRDYRRTFFILLAVLVVFRLFYMTTLPLSGDETYHWEWSRHLALGYYDHPGLTAYLIKAFTLCCGGSTEFSVRLPALVMLTATAVVCFFFARAVARCRGGTNIEAERAGFIGGLLVLIVPIFGWFSMYISTDPPLIFFWVLSLYLLFLALNGGSWGVWIGAGVAVGLAMMSKFLAFFMLPGLGLFVILSPRDRVWFRRPQAYVAAGIALAVFAPFLWWNAKHEWATFVFNFVSRQKSQGLELYHVPEFLGVQALSLSPGIFLFALFGIGRSLVDWRQRRDRCSLYLGLSSLIPFVYFLYESTRQEVSPHWPAAGWTGVLIYLSCYWATWESRGNVRLRQKLRVISLAIAAVMTALIYSVMHLPPEWIPALTYSKNPGRIDTSKNYERYGWPEMGKWVSGVRQEMIQEQGPDERGVFVICGKYATASTVAFYTPDQVATHLWGKRRVCGENYRFWDDFPSMKGQDAVYVAKSERRIVGATARLEGFFEQVGSPERLPILRDDKEVRDFWLVRCRNYNGMVPDFLE